MVIINTRVVPVESYIKNAYNLKRGYMRCLEKIEKAELRKANSHWRNIRNEKLCAERKKSRRRLRSFKCFCSQTREFVTATEDLLKKS